MIREAVTRRPKRDVVSIILLYLSWPVSLVHRFWNNQVPVNVDWFVLEVKKNGHQFKQDIQWYIYDTGNILSSLFIVASFILIKTKNRTYALSLKIILLINFIDLIHYWLCFKQSEIVTWLESMLMVLLSLYLIIQKEWKRDSKYGKPSSL